MHPDHPLKSKARAREGNDEDERRDFANSPQSCLEFAIRPNYISNPLSLYDLFGREISKFSTYLTVRDVFCHAIANDVNRKS